MRRSAALGIVLLAAAACSDGASGPAPSPATQTPAPKRPPAPRPRVRAAEEPEPPPAAPSLSVESLTRSPTLAATNASYASSHLYNAGAASASHAAKKPEVHDAPQAPAPGAPPALTAADLSEQLRATVRGEGRHESPQALLGRVEADPRLVQTAAELLATTQDEDVCRAFHAGLDKRFLWTQWWPQRPTLIRAAEAPGP